MNINGLLVTSGFFAIGLVAGHAARRLLARLRRGAVFRPPGCELFAAMASAIIGWRLAAGALPGWWFAVPLLLAWLAVPLAAVDLSVRRLPNALTYAAYPILGTALMVAALCGPDHGLAVRAVVGAGLFGGAHLVVRWLAPTALGGGDAKLAGSLGAVLGALGWQALILATALAAIITLALALTPLALAPLASTPLARTPPGRTPQVLPPPALTPSASTSPVLAPPALVPPALAPSILAPLALTSPALTSPALTRPALAPPANIPLTPTRLTQGPLNPPSSPLSQRRPLSSDISPKEAPPTPPSIPLLQRAVPHGPGLLIATWLLATFPGQALFGGGAG